MTGLEARSAETAETREVILIGTPRTDASDAADRLLDAILVALQDFDTDTLNAIADHRDTIRPGGWIQTLIREYVDVWR